MHVLPSNQRFHRSPPSPRWCCWWPLPSSNVLCAFLPIIFILLPLSFFFTSALCLHKIGTFYPFRRYTTPLLSLFLVKATGFAVFCSIAILLDSCWAHFSACQRGPSSTQALTERLTIQRAEGKQRISAVGEGFRTSTLSPLPPSNWISLSDSFSRYVSVRRNPDTRHSFHYFHWLFAREREKRTLQFNIEVR